MGKGLLPKRPQLDFLVLHGTSEEELEKRREYAQLKCAYLKDMKAYLQKHGTKQMPQIRLRECLKAENIIHKGGKGILQWRWEQFIQGRPVQRTYNYLRVKPHPDYLLLPSQPSITFESTHILHIPLNVWDAHIFPHLPDLSIFNLMLTCKQLQARAHITLYRRARKCFGLHGTPMALHAKAILPTAGALTQRQKDLFHIQFERRAIVDTEHALKTVLSSFSCIDYAKQYPQYCRRQKRAREKDELHEAWILNCAVDRANAVIEKYVGGIFKLKRQGSTAEYAEGKDFYRLGKLFGFCTKILNIAVRFVNADETNTEKLEKALVKCKPSETDLTILELLWGKLRHKQYSVISVQRFIAFLRWHCNVFNRNVAWVKTAFTDTIYNYLIDRERACSFLIDDDGNVDVL